MNPLQTVALTLAPNIAMEFIHVPAGEFLMGSVLLTDAAAQPAELPQHHVNLHEYLIAKAPVTVAQFGAFVQATGFKTTAEQHGHGWNLVQGKWQEAKGATWQMPRGAGSSVNQKSAHPVTLVSWYDALAFCKWASEQTGYALRLPTEAEWERAARGTDGRIYPWGNKHPTDKLCNFDLDRQDTSPVGQYSPAGNSPVGCMDMAGNVIEWTHSLWGPNLETPDFDYPYTHRKAERENEKASDDVRRILRGGAWDDDATGVRAAHRIPNPPQSRNNLTGFRVAGSPKPDAKK